MWYLQDSARGMDVWDPNGTLLQFTIGKRVVPGFENFLSSLFSSEEDRRERIKQDILAKLHHLKSDFTVSFVEPYPNNRYHAQNATIKLFFGIEELLARELEGNSEVSRIIDQVRTSIQTQEAMYRGYYHQANNNPEQLASAVFTAFKTFEKNSNAVTEADLNRLIGALYYYTHPRRENRPYLHCLALSMAGVTGVQYYGTRGNMAFQQHARDLLISLPDSSVHMQVYYNTAVAYYAYAFEYSSLSIYSTAKETYHKAYQYATQYDHHSLMFLSLLGMAETCYYLKEFDNAKKCLELCKEMLSLDGKITTEEHRLFEMIQNYEINLYFTQFAYQQAKEYFDRVHSALFSIFSKILVQGIMWLLGMGISGTAFRRIIVYGDNYNLQHAIFRGPTQLGSRNMMKFS